MTVTRSEAAAMLRGAEDIYICTHQSPDGDTLGSAFAIARILQGLGKRVRVLCSDEIPDKYSYMWQDLSFEEFDPKFVLAVDVADAHLLGPLLAQYAGRVDLCIDHHQSNTGYAKNLLLEDCAATVEIIYYVAGLLDIQFDPLLAACVYTGLSTDTGCFRYANTTPGTHRIAAEMMQAGADAYRINRVMFELKSRARFEIERMALDSVEYYFNGRLAVIYITQEMLVRSQAKESDLEGLAAIPRKIEGVKAGVLLREKADGGWRVSVRTSNGLDASNICKTLGGGGHARAAGCTVQGSVSEALKTVVDAVGQELNAGA